MKRFTAEELAEIISKHAKWLRSEDGGERANLSGADLSRADLSGADLSGADLSWANLSGANLSVADLSWANLSGADLSRADLSGADLSRADLSGADLSRANLSGYAQVSFKGHGECGRMLTAIKQTADSDLYFCCGCFRGSEAELRQYIADGKASLAFSRLAALDAVLMLIEIGKEAAQ